MRLVISLANYLAESFGFALPFAEIFSLSVINLVLLIYCNLICPVDEESLDFLTPMELV